MSERTHLYSAIETLLKGFDGRAKKIFVSRTLVFGPKPTLQQLASEFQLTRERVRQIESKTLDRIERRLGHRDQQPLREVTERLKGVFGSVYPLGLAETAGFCLRPRSEDFFPECLLLPVLLWLAQYEVHGEWLVKAPAGRIVRQTGDLLRRLTRQGSVNVSEALEALGQLGIRLASRQGWLEETKGFRVMGDRVVRWGRNLADKAAVVLSLAGVPMAKEEISERIREPHSIRTLANYLLGDRRFRRTGPNVFGLKVWGGDEYSSIADEIQEEIERAGGEARAEQIISVLRAKFHISEISIRAYLAGPRFVHTSRGTFRKRTETDHAPATTSVEFTRHCYRLDRGWAYRATINEQLLRGSGMPIPPAIAVQIGLKPLGSRPMSSPFGEIRCSWVSPQPTLGSVRRVVSALGGEEEDFLFIEFIGQERLDFILTKQRDAHRHQGPDRVLLEVGWNTHSPHGDPMQLIAQRLGLATNDASVLSVRRRLRARGEDDLLSHLPAPESMSEGRSLAELLELVGGSGVANAGRAVQMSE